MYRLGSFARLIVFDKRGSGMSDRVTGTATLETRMDDVRAVMDAAGSARAAIFGMLDGVPMSLLFAASYPERVSALVLLGGFARWMWAADYRWGLTEEQERVLRANMSRFIFGPRDEAAELARVFRGSEPSDEEIHVDLDYLRRAAGNPASLEAYWPMNRGVDVRHLLPAIRMPTLLIHGAETMPWSIEGARYMAERIAGAKLLELPGQRLIPFGPALDRALDETEAFLRSAWETGAWEEPEPDRVLATVLFTDIVGSSERAFALGDRAWRDLLQRHHELVRRQLVRFRGREVDTAGDGFLASFDGPARAIRCAQAIVEDVRVLGLEVRAGLHTGECELLDGKVAGIAVHTGARVASHAGASEVLVSGTVKDLVAGSGLAFQDRGSHELKGLPGEWRLFAVEHG
jgi:class 3 adenylate cyclase